MRAVGVAGAVAVAVVVSATLTCATCATVPITPGIADASTLPSAPLLAQMDWAKAGDEAFADMREYLMAPSTNPPGNEKVAAVVLQRLLEKDGIESTLWPLDAATVEEATRVNLTARLRAHGGDAKQGPLCLVSHMDVVTHEARGWPEGRGPYEGYTGIDEKNGEMTLWGRGALDMKSLGLLEVEVLRWLKRLDVKLERDVIVLAVADEEVASKGMVDAVEKHWDELKCAHAINEGGMGVRDGLFEGQTAFTISVGEKGVLWLRVKASGPPGHGSTPVPGRAPQKLMEAVNAIAKREDNPRIIPALYELLAITGGEAGGAKGFILERPALVDALVIDTLLAQPLTRAIITDTVNLTGFAGAQEPNVVPANVYAQYDIRLLPGTKPEDVVAELQRLVGKREGITFERLDARLAAVSDYRDDALYRAIAHHSVAVARAHGEERVVAGPLLSPGFTDSFFLREKGTKAYGFTPFIVTQEELATMHGDAERISKKNVTRGLETLLRIVVDASSSSSP